METKFIKTGEEFSEIAAKLKEECVEYLTEVTKANGRIKFDLEQEGEYVCVAYDGWRHPEYATNLFSTVYSISYDVDNDRLSIELEDCDDYTVNRMDASETYTVALAVYNKLKK